ncbi:beta-glucuronosyltransferase GlcAT14A-like, partial [Phalaenopsis equestris]
SAWMVLSRNFVEFFIQGWDNLPRILLMYYSNFISSSEFYFQTLLCNSPEFTTTVINHDLRYISWDNPPKQHPRNLASADLHNIISSKAPFARKFRVNESVLSRIDEEFLNRHGIGDENFVPGGWCSGLPMCSEVGDERRIEPGAGARRLAQLMDGLLKSDRFKSNQCR